MTDAPVGTPLHVVTDLSQTSFDWTADSYYDAGDLVGIGLMPGATNSGKAGVFLHFVAPTGENFVAKTTFRLLISAVRSLMSTPWVQEQLADVEDLAFAIPVDPAQLREAVDALKAQVEKMEGQGLVPPLDKPEGTGS